MPYKVFVIRADGGVSETISKKVPAYEVLKNSVGGYIETIPYFTKFRGLSRGTAYCNEEGKIKGLPFNLIATNAWMESCPGGDPTRMGLNGDVIFYAKIK
jgi:hypothetical protein